MTVTACGDGADGAVLLHLMQTAAEVQDRLERAVEAACGLTLPQLSFLHALNDGGSALPLGRVAERLCCAKSNVTQLADRLESQGLLRRESDPDDRRSVLAVLTEAGRERHQEGQLAYDQSAGEIVAVLAPGQTTQLDRILVTLRHVPS